jgi:hypothetical protein
MPLVRGNLQMMTEKQSQFDFDLLADKYNSWYESCRRPNVQSLGKEL